MIDKLRECVFDLPLAPIRLEAGALVTPHVVRAWWSGPAADLPVLQQRTRVCPPDGDAFIPGAVVRRSRDELKGLADGDGVQASWSGVPPLDPTTPTVVVIHALTGDMRAGGAAGWWAPVIGPDRALDPDEVRILCFNNLGSCYGTSGPADAGFPTRAHDLRHVPPRPQGKGAFLLDEGRLPATITSWDQARSILMALDRLGVAEVALVTGGSLGGMVALCMATLAPERIARVAPIAASEEATPWLIGWNHIGRQALLLDPDYPEEGGRGLELARQLAHMTYRAEAGLVERQGRRQAGADDLSGDWSSRAPYAVQTYLEHQGAKLRRRYDGRAYLAQLDAMDHHDIARRPAGFGATETSDSGSWGLARVGASILAVGIDSDVLYPPSHMVRLVERHRAAGGHAEYAEIDSPHGHDAFLIEWDQVDALLRRALRFPRSRLAATAATTREEGQRS